MTIPKASIWPVHPSPSFGHQVYILADEVALPLPEWACGLIELGGHLAHLPDEHPVVTVAIELPTRRYAALLIALGVVEARQQHSQYSQKAFDTLVTSGLRTPIRYRYRSVAYDGELQGSRIVAGEVHLILRRLTGEIHYLPRSMSADLISVGVADTLSTSHRDLAFTGPRAARQEEFAAQVFRRVNAGDYLLSDRLDAVLVGPAGPMGDEANLVLALRDEGGMLQPGPLSEAVRVRKWRADGSVNAQWLPPSSQDHEAPPEVALAPLAIFDGGLGYANWRYLMPGHQVLIVAPGRPGFQQGDGALSEAFSIRAGDHSLPASVTKALGETSIVAFERHA